MRKRVLWIFMAFILAMSMAMVSCETETTEEESTFITGTTTSTKPTEPVISVETDEEEKPKYGGTATIAIAADVTAFDEAFVSHVGSTTLKLTNQELLMGDWTKGPAGTGEANYVHGGMSSLYYKTGCLADTWDIPERGKIIFHIREGVYWHNKPPTDGRELTVDDVVFSIERMFTHSGSYIRMSFPTLAKDTVVTGDDLARTVTVECPLDAWADCIVLIPDFLTIMPRDAVEYYGDLNDWRNSIGTGPFMMTDYISNGSITFKRNPNYWMTNPVGPGKGDQLPYLNGVNYLVITDTATRLTAFRTGQVDSASGEYDDMYEFLDNPDLQKMDYNSDSCYLIAMRTDKADLPFSKKEVRQAIYYATDFDLLRDQYFNGRANILVWPIAYTKENAAAYVQMEELPANVQDLFSHNVTKAKDLLTQAGYPTGFDTTIVCYNTPTQVDYLSVVKQSWEEAGINLTIDAKDYNTWVARIRAKNFDELFYFYSSAAWQRGLNINGSSFYNMSYINDPHVAEVVEEMAGYVGIDEVKLAQLHHDLMPYVIEQCWVLPTPSARIYLCWWPWRKNFHGELYLGYYNAGTYLQFTWTDVDLKQDMLSGK